MSRVKREVPPVFKKILERDVELTKDFNSIMDSFLPLEKYKVHFKGLEISCHGIPWLFFWISFSWLYNDPSLVQMQMNMLLGLILDIIFVAVMKAYVRRKRPASNKDDALGQFGPDVFSFPSGHASRATFVTYFFLNLHPVSAFFMPFIVLWSAGVCVSRVLMRRHHLLDVLAGVVLGLFTGIVVGIFFISESTAHWMMNSLSDEKLDGGEFHV